jgi:hypothetical protein
MRDALTTSGHTQDDYAATVTSRPPIWAKSNGSACTLRLLIFWWLRLVLAASRCGIALRQFYVRREAF